MKKTIIRTEYTREDVIEALGLSADTNLKVENKYGVTYPEFILFSEDCEKVPKPSEILDKLWEESYKSAPFGWYRDPRDGKFKKGNMTNSQARRRMEEIARIQDQILEEWNRVGVADMESIKMYRDLSVEYHNLSFVANEE